MVDAHEAIKLAVVAWLEGLDAGPVEVQRHTIVQRIVNPRTGQADNLN